MLRLGIPVLGVTDLERAAAFWSAALDLVPTGEWQNENWRTLSHRDGSGPALGLLRSESPAEHHPRLHLDLFVESADEQRTEVQRLLALGAKDPHWDSYPREPDFVVLADPDDNVFCVVDLSHAPSS
ncbi:VOC family protein [Phaeacidiphilus oryzae]|uniref:VOC family protein n=1 Tax=Phaeacidiphilus oryzae TaxID=348818 RepID=UPI00055DA35D|nr:VOC family protein [Phaeacidiphilus oryzae]